MLVKKMLMVVSKPIPDRIVACRQKEMVAQIDVALIVQV